MDRVRPRIAKTTTRTTPQGYSKIFSLSFEQQRLQPFYSSHSSSIGKEWRGGGEEVDDRGGLAAGSESSFLACSKPFG